MGTVVETSVPDTELPGPSAGPRAPEPGKPYGSRAPWALGILAPTCLKVQQLCAASFRTDR